jgi:hypothetical protein
MSQELPLSHDAPSDSAEQTGALHETADTPERQGLIASIVDAHSVFTRREVHCYLNGVGAFRTEAQLRGRLGELSDEELRRAAAIVHPRQV